jgi:hypothetical protein
MSWDTTSGVQIQPNRTPIRLANQRSPTITLSTHTSSPRFPKVYDVFKAVRSERRNQKRVEQMLTAAGIVAVVSQLFQANDHTSVWLTFAIVWIACALGAIASSSLVFRVAEARKHITHHQQFRRTRR